MCNFYSHAPRGARPKILFRLPFCLLFLLTRPSRGATVSEFIGENDADDFYSHAPRGARPKANNYLPDYWAFLLTRPSRGATCAYFFLLVFYLDFYSHAPRGARHAWGRYWEVTGNFYSHAPRGARLRRILFLKIGFFISTHTPLAGRDS